jgi:hypothetical protein
VDWRKARELNIGILKRVQWNSWISLGICEHKTRKGFPEFSSWDKYHYL